MPFNRHLLRVTYIWARRISIAIIGFSVLAVGLAMVVLPGPAVLVIPLGLAILSLEFAWARRWLEKVKQRSHVITDRLRRGSSG